MAIADVITGGFGTFSSVNFIPTRGFSIGVTVTPTYTGAALDYYCQNTRPFYRASRIQPYFHCENTRPFYGVSAPDRWPRHIVPSIALTGLTLENGFAWLLEDGGAILQE